MFENVSTTPPESPEEAVETVLKVVLTAEKIYGNLTSMEDKTAGFLAALRVLGYDVVYAPPLMHMHGFTCGICEWGRNKSPSYYEYLRHVEETGHVGEKR